MTTWRQLFVEAANEVGDVSPVVAVAPDRAAWNTEFDDGFGLSQGPPVLVWTEDRVYLPVVYDGSEWLGSAPRNPTTDGQGHVGGQ